MMIYTSFGKMILARLKPDWVEHKFWLMVIGVLVVAVIITLLWIGWLFKLAVILFGLGALWIFWAGDIVQAACGLKEVAPFLWGESLLALLLLIGLVLL